MVACAHLDQSDDELRKLGRPSRSEFAARHRIKPYSQVAAMVKAEGLHLVFVCARDSVKAEQAVLAADAGAHVYLSKPMCKTLAGADAMIAAAQRNKVLISALIPGRYDGAIRAVYDRVAVSTLAGSKVK